ncbi:hypothetical protein RvY_16199 [Ramazzottius varieornatus]|uniref:Uncharacterized protein n=1 Tax=Ramazzottius varieornatus TaxID=947166 RepID=A0A1D1VXM1_RAMVA|nr:hypothetical protein RvY_16199 [Ramazzottius varieornatus]
MTSEPDAGGYLTGIARPADQRTKILRVCRPQEILASSATLSDIDLPDPPHQPAT